MAIAFQAVANNAFNGVSSFIVSLTLNAGDTHLVWVNYRYDIDAGASVSSVTDNAAGGSSVYTKRGTTLVSTTEKQELWATDVGGGKAATVVTLTMSDAGTSGEGTVATYSGVQAYGTRATQTGSTANPSIAVTTQDNSNFVATCFVDRAGTGPTAGAGTLRIGGTTSNGTDIAVVDNTAATPQSVTCSITDTAGEWLVIAMELRTTTGGGGPAAARRQTPGSRDFMMVS